MGEKKGDAVIDERDWKTMLLSCKGTGTAAEETLDLEVINVCLLSSVDWNEMLQTKFDSLLVRNWKFKEKLDEETIAFFEDNFPEYIGEDQPARRIKAKKKRKKKPK